MQYVYSFSAYFVPTRANQEGQFDLSSVTISIPQDHGKHMDTILVGAPAACQDFAVKVSAVFITRR